MLLPRPAQLAASVVLTTMLAVLALLIPTTVRAAPASEPLEIGQSLLDDDGWPELLASGLSNYEDPAQATFQWRICSPGCGEVVSEDAFLSPGPTAAGTRFQVTGTLAGKATTTMSRPWLGRAENVAPPTITGSPVIGATIAAHAGTWRGGWGNDASYFGLRACRTLAAIDCRAMQNSAISTESKPTPLRIPTAYGGWYVGAVETRFAAETVWAGVGSSFPGNMVSRNTMRRLGPTDAASPLIGPIPAATPEQLVAAKPTVVLRSRGTRRGRLIVLGTITCPEGCEGSTFVTQGNPDEGEGGELEVRAGRPRTLAIDARSFKAGRSVKAEVVIDGEGRFAKRVRLP